MGRDKDKFKKKRNRAYKPVVFKGTREIEISLSSSYSDHERALLSAHSLLWSQASRVFFFFFFWMYVYNNSISFLVIKSLVSLKKRCQEKKSKVIGTRNHHPTICIPLVLFYLEILFDLMWWKPSQINMNVVYVCVCVCVLCWIDSTQVIIGI